MATFKCKMCGGDLIIEQGSTVAECEYCGSKQTLPKLDDDRRANLYDRANHFRRNNEFDKAAGIYEQILNEDTTDAEAYWSLVLCRYGIEYVEDPATRKRVPTVNRAQFTSIFDDDNYRSALQYADGYQRSIYEAEANAINEIQKGILAISQKEEPFDVFICYKETDTSGRRTMDSVLANDLYHQLTQEGFKVFFSRITLEDKLGTAYEPYIFAALNSAKIMVVLGTKPEHFKAVWVKNEWSRFLTLVKQSGGKKVLIPAYRDMDPYDLPEEFSHLQAQDMSKLGFMQDLIRGIKKIAKADEPKATVKETVVVGSGNANVAPLLERAFLFLEDGKWQDANIYCEKVLDIDPRNAEAYLGKLMADLQVRTRRQLADCAEPFDSRENYGKVLRFGDQKLESEMRGYISHINERAEVCRKDAIYANARSQMTGEAVTGYESAIRTFQTISGWKDADGQIRICRGKIEEIKAKEKADRLERERQAEEWRLECERQAEERRIAAEKAAKKRKRTIAIVTPIIATCIAFVILLTTVIIPKAKLNKAMGLLDSGDYEAAYALLEEIGNSDAIASSKYDRAVAFIDSGDYEAAYLLLNGLNYKDSAEKLESVEPQYQRILFSKAQVGDYIIFGTYEQDSNSSNGKEDIEWLVLAREGDRLLVISKYALDYQKYNTTITGVTWASCSLRTWLNGTFINNAFSSDEQAMIRSTTVTADKNPSYSTSPGNDTNDKLFLLSITEVNKYFSTDSARQCQGTAYCYAQGAYKASNGNCWWWLRSPGNYSYYAALVLHGGSVYNRGDYVNYGAIAVRPALWIDLGS